MPRSPSSLRHGSTQSYRQSAFRSQGSLRHFCADSSISEHGSAHCREFLTLPLLFGTPEISIYSRKWLALFFQAWQLTECTSLRQSIRRCWRFQRSSRHKVHEVSANMMSYRSGVTCKRIVHRSHQHPKISP